MHRIGVSDQQLSAVDRQLPGLGAVTGVDRGQRVPVEGGPPIGSGGFGQGQEPTGVARLQRGGELVGVPVDHEGLGRGPVLGDHAQLPGGLRDPPETVVVRQRLSSQAGGPVEGVDHGGVGGRAQFGAGVEHVLDAVVDEGHQGVPAPTGGQFGDGPVHGDAGIGRRHDALLAQTRLASAHHHVVDAPVLPRGDDERARAGPVGADALQGSRDGGRGVRGERAVDALPHPHSGGGEGRGQSQGRHTDGEATFEPPPPPSSGGRLARAPPLDHVAEGAGRRGGGQEHGGGGEGQRDTGPDLGRRPPVVGLDHDPAGHDGDEQPEQGQRPSRRDEHPVAEQQQGAQGGGDEAGRHPEGRGAGTARGEQEQFARGGPRVGQFGPVQPGLQQP